MADVAASVESFFNGDLQSIAIRAGRIVLILVVAFVLARLVRRAARRLAARLADRQDLRRSQGEDSAGPLLLALGEKVAEALPLLDRKERSAQRARTLGAVLGSVSSIAIYAIAIMLCLSELDVNLAPVLAGAGIAGIALGFGAQSLVRDFLSGIFIIIEDQYGVGDIVDVGEASGVVEEVTLRITRLRAVDGTVWHVPNGEIRRSGNHSQYWARVVLDVPVAYDADISTVSALIKQTADDAWRDCEAGDILEEPELWGVEEFGADSIAIRLVVKTLPGSQWTVARRLRAQLKHALDQAGFEIPFPQRTVWLRGQWHAEPGPPSPEPGDTAAGPS